MLRKMAKKRLIIQPFTNFFRYYPTIYYIEVIIVINIKLSL